MQSDNPHLDPDANRDRPSGWPAELPFRAWRMWAIRVLFVVLGLAVLAGVFALGTAAGYVKGRFSTGAEPAAEAADAEKGDEVLYWTCSMHPQVKLPKFGQCPICFMDLVPVRAGEQTAEGAAEIALSERAQMLARVETAPVELRELVHEIRMVGKVTPDETRIKQISSYVSGRLDRLFVNYTGILVRKGDHLAEIYSPELLVAQREYLLAHEQGADSLAPPGAAPKGSEAMSRALLDAARRKLELWGVPQDEIDRLARERTPTDHIRIDAPIEGWVLERQGFEGMYVETGTRLFTVADLREVWVMLDAYELDVGYIRLGQEVEFETEAFPGEVFTGPVSYLDPVLDAETRTLKVRVIVPNPEMKLRPDMFVRARLRVRIGEGGAVVDNPLAGKWLCYMHPEIVKDGPGACDLCGMDLVTAESLGYAREIEAAPRALAVPRTAVLLTGKRAVVYVEKSTEDRPVYEGRVVQLGPRAGDYYVVESGLRPGERVVTRGALMIDSALQIQAKASMMQPLEGGEGEGERASEAARVEPESRHQAGAAYHAHVRPVVAAYFDLVTALAAEDLDGGTKALAGLRKSLAEMTPHGLEGEDAELFRSQVSKLAEALPGGPAGEERRDGTRPRRERPAGGSPDAAPSLDELRNALPAVTEALALHLRTFGHDRDAPVARMFCSMAFDDKGAEWLQPDTQVRNPYFAHRMLRCGEVTGLIAAGGAEEKTDE